MCLFRNHTSSRLQLSPLTQLDNMALVHGKDSNASIISLILAILSIVSCLLVISSIFLYPKARESFHLQLVNRLLLSDLGVSVCVVFYYAIQFLISSHQLEQMCKVYFPVLLYFFISSFTCTCILSLRFRTMNSQEAQRKVWTPPIHLNYVWVIPLISFFTVLITAWATGQATTAHINAQDTNQVCTLNHDTNVGMSMDIVFFQLPLLCTILINGYFYTKGILALRNSPHSVIARQMNRAGGYMLVLLVVWVPNISYNLLTIFVGNNDSYQALLDLCVFLTSSQGLLDVAVYVWSNHQLRKWLFRNVVFLRVFEMCLNKKETDGSKPQEDADSDDDDWLQTSLSFSGQTPGELSSVVNGQVENPINAASIRNIDRAMKTKSILISSSKTKNSNSDFESGAELDQEKFVRFGEYVAPVFFT